MSKVINEIDYVFFFIGYFNNYIIYNKVSAYINNKQRNNNKWNIILCDWYNCIISVFQKGMCQNYCFVFLLENTDIKHTHTKYNHCLNDYYYYDHFHYFNKYINYKRQCR